MDHGLMRSLSPVNFIYIFTVAEAAKRVAERVGFYFDFEEVTDTSADHFEITLNSWAQLSPPISPTLAP